MVEFPGAANKKSNKAESGEEKQELAMFTGTLIDDLIATVERAEQAIQAQSSVTATLIADSWFASTQENTDTKSLGVA